MKRFAIEHLPRAVASYQVTPIDYDSARAWLAESNLISLVRTTELASAIASGLGVVLNQSDTAMTLQPGDEAILISLSFSVMLAWVQGSITPLSEDWRCLLLRLESPAAATPALEAAASEDLTSH
jgi:hypothetical protein